MSDVIGAVQAATIKGSVSTATIQGRVATNAIITDAMLGGVVIRVVPAPDGDWLGYGSRASCIVGVGAVDSMILADDPTAIVGLGYAGGMVLPVVAEDQIAALAGSGEADYMILTA